MTGSFPSVPVPVEVVVLVVPVGGGLVFPVGGGPEEEVAEGRGRGWLSGPVPKLLRPEVVLVEVEVLESEVEGTSSLRGSRGGRP